MPQRFTDPQVQGPVGRNRWRTICHHVFTVGRGSQPGPFGSLMSKERVYLPQEEHEVPGSGYSKSAQQDWTTRSKCPVSVNQCDSIDFQLSCVSLYQLRIWLITAHEDYF